MKIQESISSYGSFEYKAVAAEAFKPEVLSTIEKCTVENDTVPTRDGNFINRKVVVFYFKSGASPRKETISANPKKIYSALNSMEVVDPKDVVLVTMQNCQGRITRAMTRAEAESLSE